MNSPASFDQLVGEREQLPRNGKAERLGGLEVQDHLELGRKLNGKIARLLAAQDAIHIRGGAMNDVYHVDPVGEQTAVFDKKRYKIGRRYIVPGGRRYDRRAMHAHEYIRQ